MLYFHVKIVIHHIDKCKLHKNISNQPSAIPPSFVPPRRYSSGWALACWIISLHFSLFFICSDEASNGRMKKWEECGWKRSWATYFRWFSIHSIHPRLIIWFLNNLVLWCKVVSLTPNPQPGGPGYHSSSRSYPLTCPAWVLLPVATLPPA
jgi:hypothetical protein